MLSKLEKISLDGSLGIQAITLFTNLFSLQIPLDTKDLILKDILGLETLVQIVELIFYIWYRTNILHTDFDVTQFRYYDWFLTTPLMLFTTACFYIYLAQENNKETESRPTIQSIVETHKKSFLGIFLCNALMLLFGYLQELNFISILTSSLFGYLSLLGSFGILYTQFVKQVPQKQGLFYFMFLVWSFYGFGAMLPRIPKNITYNILDIFAKNFYGVFLSYIILQKQQKQTQLN
jgi:bacteriorhodopsin